MGSDELKPPEKAAPKESMGPLNSPTHMIKPAIIQEEVFHLKKPKKVVKLEDGKNEEIKAKLRELDQEKNLKPKTLNDVGLEDPEPPTKAEEAKLASTLPVPSPQKKKVLTKAQT